MVFVTTAICMIIFGILYGFLRKKQGNKSLIWKALATSMPMIVAFTGAVKTQGLYGWLITAGIVICMVADVVLEINFIKGIIVFGCAHICFTAAYLQVTSAGIQTVLVFLLIYAAVVFVFRKALKEMKELKIPAFIYMAFLVFMVSMSATVFTVYQNHRAVLAFMGSACFLISDCIIGFRTVYDKKSNVYGAVILILYYGAVYAIGSSVIL